MSSHILSSFRLEFEEPQSSAFSAKIFSDGRMVFDEEAPAEIPSGKAEPSEKVHTFRFQTR